jgi:hypothetical protein
MDCLWLTQNLQMWPMLNPTCMQLGYILSSDEKLCPKQAQKKKKQISERIGLASTLRD